jgi:hypothetical protein
LVGAAATVAAARVLDSVTRLHDFNGTDSYFGGTAGTPQDELASLKSPSKTNNVVDSRELGSCDAGAPAPPHRFFGPIRRPPRGKTYALNHFELLDLAREATAGTLPQSSDRARRAVLARSTSVEGLDPLLAGRPANQCLLDLRGAEAASEQPAGEKITKRIPYSTKTGSKTVEEAGLTLRCAECNYLVPGHTIITQTDGVKRTVAHPVMPECPKAWRKERHWSITSTNWLRLWHAPSQNAASAFDSSTSASTELMYSMPLHAPSQNAALAYVELEQLDTGQARSPVWSDSHWQASTSASSEPMYSMLLHAPSQNAASAYDSSTSASTELMYSMPLHAPSQNAAAAYDSSTSASSEPMYSDAAFWLGECSNIEYSYMSSVDADVEES